MIAHIVACDPLVVVFGIIAAVAAAVGIGYIVHEIRREARLQQDRRILRRAAEREGE